MTTSCYNAIVQVYTKILIGMLVGAVLGLTLGPNSPLLPADIYAVDDWERLQLQVDREDPATALPMPSPGTQGPLRLELVRVERRAETDDRGTTHDLPAWSRVRLTWTPSLAARDAQGSVHAALGAPKPGEAVELWLRHELTPLRSGGFMVWPVAISGFGDRLLQWLAPVGDAFMRLITMVIVPLVFSSLVVGVASLGDVRKLGRLGVRTLGLYLVTTAFAVTLGLLCASLIRPGAFIDEASQAALQAQYSGAADQRVEAAAAAPSAIDNLLAIIPLNPAASLANGDMLQIIFFAVIFGVALTLLPRTEGTPIVTLLARLQDAMVIVIHMVMSLAPYGVAALLAEVVGTSGYSVLQGLLVYALAVLVGLALHGLLVYGSLVRFAARLPFFGFLRAIRPATLIAFSTSSSSATLPVTMECAEQNLRVSNPVASFVIPLGSTVNMDGTALYQGVAALFIAQVFQMELSLADQLGIVLTATMASIGAAGVPGAGMVTLAMVLSTAGIPTVGVALILGMDRILDMFRTTINVVGDLSVAAVMGRLEGDPLAVMTPQEDRADPERGFEGRLDHPPTPLDPDAGGLSSGDRDR